MVIALFLYGIGAVSPGSATYQLFEITLFLYGIGAYFHDVVNVT